MTDEELMDAALEEARAAGARGEVPVGAVVSAAGVIVARAGNRREAEQDPTAHAEVLALRSAAKVLGKWRLDALALHVTLEPCAMCAGAAVNARLGRLVYGAADLKAGAAGSLYNLCVDPRLNHEMPVTAGVRAEECSAVLSGWFSGVRELKGRRPGEDR